MKYIFGALILAGMTHLTASALETSEIRPGIVVKVEGVACEVISAPEGGWVWVREIGPPKISPVEDGANQYPVRCSDLED